MTNILRQSASASVTGNVSGSAATTLRADKMDDIATARTLPFISRRRVNGSPQEGQAPMTSLGESLYSYNYTEEAVAIAKHMPYGLAARVWTQSTRLSILMSERLHADTIWLNTYRAVSFMSPFGGYKRLGLGRENGQDAIYEYLQQKSIWISTATEVPNPFVMR